MIPDYGKGGIMSKRNNKPAKNVKEIAVDIAILSSWVLPNSEIKALYGVLQIVMAEEITENW